MDTVHNEGWVKLHRKIQWSAVFQNEGLLKVWIWCLVRGSHQDEWASVKTGKGETEVLVKRGQFMFGRKSAAKALKMDESTVYKRMKKLENMRNCNIESNIHYSIVTILNWEVYQSMMEPEVTPKVTPKEQPSNTYKNVKNVKNLKNGRKKDSDPRVKEFLSYWGEIFQKETEQPYFFSYGKDGKLVRDLLTVHPLDTLQETTKAFFRDEQCRRRGLTIGIFFQEFNRLISQKAMNPLEQTRREMRAREEGGGD